MGTDRRGRGETRYCSHCGDDLVPSMNYCPGCGTRTDRRATTAGGRSSEAERSRRTRSTGRRSDRHTTASRDRARLEAKIAAATSEGWDLEHDAGDHAVMVRRSVGDVDDHLLVALITGWWTMGLGNVVYGAYRYVEDAERMVLRPEMAGTDETVPEDESSRSDLLPRVAAITCLLTGAIVAVAGAFLLGTAPGPVLAVLFGLATLFGALGLSAWPSVSRRLERRHSMTANGRTRSVDERPVVSYDHPCTACGDPIGRGVERTYRSAFCVLGVPLTGSEGRNYYCRACVEAERSAVPDDRSTARRAVRSDAGRRENGTSPETDADAPADELESDSVSLD